MITFYAVVLKLCFKEPLSFNKVVSEMVRLRDTHHTHPFLHFWGLPHNLGLGAERGPSLMRPRWTKREKSSL